jgi:hypothetical protein
LKNDVAIAGGAILHHVVISRAFREPTRRDDWYGEKIRDDHVVAAHAVVAASP